MIKYFDINRDGVSIRCKLYCEKPRDTERIILYVHGFGGHMDNKAAERFAGHALSKHKHLGLLCFNLPCHGSDVKKKISLEDCEEYITFVTEYAREELGAKDLYVYGTSFGGYLILKYIIEKGNPFRRIVLRCPAINMYESLTRRVMDAGAAELLAKGKDAQVGFDRKILVGNAFLEALKAADIRKYEYFDYADDILILQGTKDEIISPEAVQQFCEDNVIEYVPIENADHRFQDAGKMDLANSIMLNFLQL